ncbi:MAG: hypothetical protein HY719_00980 [Planctomycetes bacterium]|nr:hypothetical protein [Planctomycetota bacterium]
MGRNTRSTARFLSARAGLLAWRALDILLAAALTGCIGAEGYKVFEGEELYYIELYPPARLKNMVVWEPSLPAHEKIRVLDDEKDIDSWKNWAPPPVQGFRYGHYFMVSEMSIEETAAFYKKEMAARGWITEGVKEAEHDYHYDFFHERGDYCLIALARKYVSVGEYRVTVEIHLNPPVERRAATPSAEDGASAAAGAAKPGAAHG